MEYEVYDTIADNYDRTQREGESLLLYCQTCADNGIVRSKSSAPLQVIIVDYLWQRVQINLIGFSKQLDTDHKKGLSCTGLYKLGITNLLVNYSNNGLSTWDKYVDITISGPETSSIVELAPSPCSWDDRGWLFAILVELVRQRLSWMMMGE